MALQEYITIADIHNKVFDAFSDATKQIYVDKANDECEDMAKVKGILDLTTIAFPVHFKVKEYLIHYATQQLALDNADFNNRDGRASGEDKYDSTFTRESYVVQGLHNKLTLIMFTGLEETPQNRAVFSQRIRRA